MTLMDDHERWPTEFERWRTRARNESRQRLGWAEPRGSVDPLNDWVQLCQFLDNCGPQGSSRTLANPLTDAGLKRARDRCKSVLDIVTDESIKRPERVRMITDALNLSGTRQVEKNRFWWRDNRIALWTEVLIAGGFTVEQACKKVGSSEKLDSSRILRVRNTRRASQPGKKPSDRRGPPPEGYNGWSLGKLLDAGDDEKAVSAARSELLAQHELFESENQDADVAVLCQFDARTVLRSEALASMSDGSFAM